MDRIFIFLTDLSGGGAYFIIFGILVACGLGFPLPEDIPLIATGYLIWDGTLSWATSLLVTLLGVGIGDACLYGIGRKLGTSIAGKKGEKIGFVSPERLKRARAYFRKYGYKIVFFARFVAGVRAAVFFLAGAMKMPFRKFIWLDMIAAILSVPIWLLIGYALGHYFGSEIGLILEKMKHLKSAITFIILSITVAFIIRAYIKFRRRKLA